MKNKNVKSLKFDGRREHDGEKTLNYAIEYEGDKTTIVSINLPLNGRPVKTDELIFANKSFVNGFKAVKTKNGEYGYIREEDNCLLPYRYDVALDFNEHGLAMVGKHSYVTWINKNFEYLDTYGEMRMEQEGLPFSAWNEVDAFSKGKIPLSLVSKRLLVSGIDVNCYVDILGKIKSFVRYNEEMDFNSQTIEAFLCSTPFNEQGYAETVEYAVEYILSAKGYMISKIDLLEKCLDTGLADSFFDDIDKKYEEQNRTLKR